MSPSEAIRLARATMACGDSVLIEGDTVNGSACSGDNDYGELYQAAEAGGVASAHAPVASALLDGFSVDEITEAGG